MPVAIALQQAVSFACAARMALFIRQETHTYLSDSFANSLLCDTICCLMFRKYFLWFLLIPCLLKGQVLPDSVGSYQIKLDLRAAIGLADTQLALQFCTQLQSAGHALQKPALVGEALFFRAYMQKEQQVANNIYNEALQYFDTATEKVWHLYTNTNLGFNHQVQGYFQLGLLYYQRAYQFAEALQDTFAMTDKLASLSLICSDVENFDRGIYYAQEGIALAAHLPTGDKEYQLSRLYNAMGINHDLKGDYENALLAHNKNLALNAQEAYFSRFSIYNNLGNTYSKMGKWNEAATFWNQADVNMQGDPYSRSTIALNLGRLYLHKKDFARANIQVTAALEAAQQSQSYEKIRDALEQKSAYYEAIGDYQTALLYNRQYIQLRDSLLNEAKHRALAEADIQFDAQNKTAKNLLLSKQNAEQQLLIEKRNNQLLWVGFFVVLMVLLFVALWYMNQMIKKQQALKSQQALQQARFAAVMETEEKERQRIASELHDGLGQVLTSARLNAASLEGEVAPEDAHLLQNTLELLDRSIEEVRAIAHNMMPVALASLSLHAALRDVVQKTNAASIAQIAAQFECLEHIQVGEVAGRTIYRCIQELLNNTLKHAKATKITIHCAVDGADLTIVFTDNGVGFNPAKLGETSGLGWANISSRLAWLGGNILLTSTPGVGTCTTLRIPISACK